MNNRCVQVGLVDCPSDELVDVQGFAFVPGSPQGDFLVHKASGMCVTRDEYSLALILAPCAPQGPALVRNQVLFCLFSSARDAVSDLVNIALRNGRLLQQSGAIRCVCAFAFYQFCWECPVGNFAPVLYRYGRICQQLAGQLQMIPSATPERLSGPVLNAMQRTAMPLS